MKPRFGYGFKVQSSSRPVSAARLRQPGGRRGLRVFLLVAAMLLAALALSFLAYVSDYARANTTALAALSAQDDGVRVERRKDMVLFTPVSPVSDIGVVFYPGGKVEADAYAPLLRMLARRGFASVLLEVPFHLAFFDIGAAERGMAAYPDAARWVVAGHSLGGTAASLYAEKNPGGVNGSLSGMILLGSYPAADLSFATWPILSLRGARDLLVTEDDWLRTTGYLPERSVSKVLEGGNHAQFGSYGVQQGDGMAEVSAQAQWEWTVLEMETFLRALSPP